MLTIQPSKESAGTCTPNVLPCRIDRTGPVDASEKHWAPVRGPDDEAWTAYLRGRRLKGTAASLPQGYRGVVLGQTGQTLPQNGRTQDAVGFNSLELEEDNEDEDGVPKDVRILEERASFNEIVVWSHEAPPDQRSDPYLKGVNEWCAFAEQMHSYSAIRAEKGKDSPTK
ncbi:MAG: hypothetical protein M1833_005476 [Piccolia ochrophora]|nr:MAG: hypothetical protein M1833_005476 [Piccolia ochrophora]